MLLKTAAPLTLQVSHAHYTAPPKTKLQNCTMHTTAYSFISKVATHFFHVSVSLSMWGMSMNVIAKSWVGQDEYAHLRGGSDITKTVAVT